MYGAFPAKNTVHIHRISMVLASPTYTYTVSTQYSRQGNRSYTVYIHMVLAIPTHNLIAPSTHANNTRCTRHPTISP